MSGPRCKHGLLRGQCATCPAVEVRGYHPACLAQPAPTVAEVTRLAADLREHGMREPITVTPDGLIVDGRLRYLAADVAGVEVRVEVVALDAVQAAELVAGRHLLRRHLTAGQRAMMAERLAALLAGRGKAGGVGKDRAAQIVGLSEDYVRRARILRNRAPGLAARVERGDLSLPGGLAELRRERATPRACESAADVLRELMRLDGELAGAVERSIALRLLALEAARFVPGG